jgi:hypothetical protein
MANLYRSTMSLLASSRFTTTRSFAVASTRQMLVVRGIHASRVSAKVLKLGAWQFFADGGTGCTERQMHRTGY